MTRHPIEDVRAALRAAGDPRTVFMADDGHGHVVAQIPAAALAHLCELAALGERARTLLRTPGVTFDRTCARVAEDIDQAVLDARRAWRDAARPDAPEVAA